MNSGFDYREKVPNDLDGTPLMDYLSRRYRHSTRDAWERRIAAGQVLIDGQPARADSPLRRGQTLLWRRPPWVEPEAPLAFAVLYESADLLAVAKPSGLPTLPGGGFLENTLLRLVRRYSPQASPLHRLGRFTSGLVLCGKTREARTELSRNWGAESMLKRYRALAAGQPRDDRFEIDTPIGPVPHRLLGSIHAASPSGKPSSSRVTVLERRGDCFVCDVAIRTGRPHQIRIHLAAAGFPLVGDPLYLPGGLPAAASEALPGDPGYRLHAAELSFPELGGPGRRTVSCPPPQLLRVVEDDLPPSARPRAGNAHSC